ncbi:hypothetical protein BDP55DRAFT_270479 [Colletotrichum godetiae]|uniref:Uncharacterized protein n=1 Tax=Colletotrichum godetiae TaxID=1209918 RepID=A0AAJ0EY11_9PEZI|nr:uncharacterized protein BDP55DRAFT_270479 [Colletotrichum godetiae]KAK1691644.1 hypothetical protein BDP55DRAFT_270479 [Colletotrichum godetiae]
MCVSRHCIGLLRLSFSSLAARHRLLPTKERISRDNGTIVTPSQSLRTLPYGARDTSGTLLNLFFPRSTTTASAPLFYTVLPVPFEPHSSYRKHLLSLYQLSSFFLFYTIIHVSYLEQKICPAWVLSQPEGRQGKGR